MNRALIISLLCLVPFGLVFAGETVHLRNGKFQEGEIVSQSDAGITFRFTRTGATESTRVEIPWDSVDHIEFDPVAGEVDALKNPGGTELSTWGKLWRERSPWLSRPRSNAAEIGLHYAEKLAASGEEMAPEQAVDLLSLISEKAWEPEKQAAAVRRRLLVLLDMGEERRAIREAEALAESSENPALLLEAKLVLASTAFENLRELEEEHPRWFLDDEVRPERNRLFNAAVDHSLFAFLFHGSRENASARGLIHASKVYAFAGDDRNARLCAEDILKLYSETGFVSIARDILRKLSQEKLP